jgi:hypothetical protein
MKLKQFSYFTAVALTGLFMLFGCGSSSKEDGAVITDYSTGTMASVDAVSASGGKTVLMQQRTPMKWKLTANGSSGRVVPSIWVITMVPRSSI